MNSGFSNLDFLKKQILAKTMASDKRFDDLILAIGLGVAGQFSRFCNRDWMYQQNIAEVGTGDRSFWYVRSAPVTQFSGVNLRFFRTDAWTSILNQPLQADEEKGLNRAEEMSLGKVEAERRRRIDLAISQIVIANGASAHCPGARL